MVASGASRRLSGSSIVAFIAVARGVGS
jgi:hypothetical protein